MPVLRNRRLLIFAASALVLVLAWTALGFLAAPGLIASTAKEQSRKLLGRELAIGAVRFNPFTFELELSDLKLPDGDGSELLRFHRLAVDFEPVASLWRRGWAFRRIALEGPGVRALRRADGRWNLQDLSVRSAPAAVAPKQPSAPLRLWIERLEVRGGEGIVIDRSRGAERTEKFSPVEFSLTDFSTVADGNRYALRASAPDIGSIEWHGTVEVEPLHSRGEFHFASINLPRIASWVEDLLPMQLHSGTAGLDGSYEFALEGESPRLDARVARLEIAALGLRARGASEDWVAVPRLLVTGVRFELPQKRVHVAEVSVERAHVALALDGQMRPNLVAMFVSGSATAPAASQPLLHWTLDPIDVSARELSWPFDSPVPLQAAIGIDGGGRLALRGTVDPRTEALQLEVEATQLPLTSLQPLLARSTSVMLGAGTVSAQGVLRSDADGGGHFSGTLSCDGLRASDRVVREDLLRWKSLHFDGVEFSQRPFSVSVREVVAREPYARLIIARDGTTNLSDALAPPGQRIAPPPVPSQGEREPLGAKAGLTPDAKAAKAAKAAKPGAAQGKGLPIEMRRVRVVDGSMNFADYTLPERFGTGIMQLNGTIDGLSGKPESRAKVKLEGKVDRYAPVQISGEVNYFAAKSYTDVKMSFHNIELTTFSPYSGKFAGYRIDRGKLSLDAGYRIVDRKLVATHHLVIDQLQLGERVESKDAVSLPLKLAIALLKDRNGVIDLDLPVSGSLDDPQFRIAPIVWRMLKNLLVKVVTAPFALLGALFGSGPELEYVDFAPGSAVLEPAAASRLATLRKGLVDRPALNLDIPLVRDPQVDTPALLAARWQDLLSEAASRQFGERARQAGFLAGLQAQPADYRRFLEGLYRAKLGHKPEIPKPAPAAAAGGAGPAVPDVNAAAIPWLEQALRSTLQVTDEDLGALAKARTDAVQQVLLQNAEIDPSRIFVIAQAPPAAGRPSGGPEGRIRLQLSLK